MSDKNSPPSDETAPDAQKMAQGKALAQLLFNYKISDLQNLPDAQRQAFREQFPLLSDDEIHNVIVLIADTKRRQRHYLAWEMAPRDVAIVLVAILTWLTIDWKIAAILGVFAAFTAAAVLSARYSPKMSPLLKGLGWASYLACLAFGWFFYANGQGWNVAVLAAVGLWLAALVVAFIARLMLSRVAQAQSSEPPGQQ